MNWLQDVLTKISKSDAPESHRYRLMIRAVDLSEICDRWVPHAPAPQIEWVSLMQELHCSWFWKAQQRVLTVGVERDGALFLHMLHGTYASDTDNPNFEGIKRAVQSFFDGWVPGSTINGEA